MVRWQYHGQNTDLLSFKVTVETDGRDTVTKEVAATQREADIDGLCPLTESSVTVAAVYSDEIRTESSVEFSSEGIHVCVYMYSEICSYCELKQNLGINSL